MVEKTVLNHLWRLRDQGQAVNKGNQRGGSEKGQLKTPGQWFAQEARRRVASVFDLAG